MRVASHSGLFGLLLQKNISYYLRSVVSCAVLRLFSGKTLRVLTTTDKLANKDIAVKSYTRSTILVYLYLYFRCF